ncbi:MAG: hypothetical protein AB7U82_18595 [Blastocatellales bacterium]
MDNDTQLAVFENGADNDAEKDRSRALLIVGAIAVVVLAALITLLLMTKPASEREVENMVRAGSPEFEAYKNKVELEVTDKVVHPNMIGMWQLEARARLTNRGDRPLKAVEVNGKMLDLEDKVLAQTNSRPIPRIRQAPLNPGESMNISVKVDAPAKVSEAEVKDIIIELRGLRFQ